jgi:hypothetical protein
VPRSLVALLRVQNQFGKARQGDIAAADEGSRPLAFKTVGLSTHRRCSQAALRLDHDLHLLREEVHHLYELRIADSGDRIDLVADDREIVFTEVGDHRTVGDGMWDRDGDDFTLGQGLLASLPASSSAPTIRQPGDSSAAARAAPARRPPPPRQTYSGPVFVICAA